MNHSFNHAKWILAFNAPFFILLLLNSCDTTTANTDITTTTTTVVAQQSINLMFVCDISNRHNAAEIMTVERAEDAIHILSKTNSPVSTSATHVSYSPPQFVNMFLEVVPPPPDKFALDYPEKEKARQEIIDKNTDALIQFRSDFDTKITDFELTPKTDWSYVNLYGRKIADFLRGDANTRSTKIVVWSTDFLNHPKGQKKGKLISPETVTEINDALAASVGRTKLYVITTAPKKGTALESLNATFLSSFFQVSNSLKSNFPPAQK